MKRFFKKALPFIMLSYLLSGTPLLTRRTVFSESVPTSPTTKAPTLTTLSEVWEYIDSLADPTQHGGAYWGDSRALLHVNLIKDSPLYAILPKMEGLIIHEVSFDYASLRKLQRSIVEVFAREKDRLQASVMVFLNSEENHLMVGINPLSDESREAIYAITPDPAMVSTHDATLFRDQ